MPNVRGGAGSGFGGAASAGRNSTTSSAGARSGDSVGGTKRAGNATVADHLIATGAISVPSIGPGGVKAPPGGTQDDAYNDYSKAVGQEGVKSLGARILDFFSPFGISNMPVDSQRPWTFDNGTYHPGWNPGSIAGMAAGALLPGLGVPVGAAAQKIYTGLGGHMVPLAGYNGAEAGTSPTTDPTKSSWGSTGPAKAPGATRTENNGAWGGTPVTPTPGGAPFGPQPTSPTDTGSSGGNANGWLRPRLPNHSLPYGYQSAFPNSLSDEDKALLYARALA